MATWACVTIAFLHIGFFSVKSHKSFHKGFCFLKNLYLLSKLCGVKDGDIPTFSNVLFLTTYSGISIVKGRFAVNFCGRRNNAGGVITAFW